MKYIALIVLSLLLHGCSLFKVPAQAQPVAEGPDVVQRAVDNTVALLSGEDGVYCSGVAAEGVIITAEHCAPPEGQGFRIAYRGKVYTGIVITRNANRDFAIVQAVGARIKDTVPFSDIAPIMGQKVVWIGYPLSYEMVMSTGIVGNASSNADESVEGFFVVSGQFIPGASGGPVFDERGLLLGIVSRTATFGPALIPLGYAVPVSDILQAIKDL